jgi:RNA polymerase sigma-70 factor (ECF subfamily)
MVADPEALFKLHRQHLFRYFYRAVGQVETARDLTQDVFLRVARSEVPEAGDKEVKAWLFHIARNLALDHHRSRRRHPTPATLTDDVGRLPSQDVDLAVNEALGALDEVDRDVFLMREVAGLGYADIATICSLTPDAVRSRIHRTRLQLRATLSAPIATRRTAPMRHSGRDLRGKS